MSCNMLSLLLLITSLAQTAAPPQPPPEPIMDAPYKVKVNGRAVKVHVAPVWYPENVRPFGGPYAFASFEVADKAEVEITTDRPLDKVRILPKSSGVRPHVKGRTLSFTLSSPCQLSIEPNAKKGPLLLFANPPEHNRPDPNSPDVKYYGPGEHQAGLIELHDGQTLYLAPGAVVYGGVHATGKNIRVRGQGILDGGSWERFKGPGQVLMHLDACSNATVEGIILKDSWGWTSIVGGSENVTIQNVKICSARCENNDGLDIVNSQGVTVKDCFIRSDDDCIAPKGCSHWFPNEPARPVENLLVEHCVLWSDRAHIWRLGCESQAPYMRHLVFRDIDVIHYTDPFCPVVSIQPAEDMSLEDVLFEDIRIRHEGQEKFLELDPHPTQWAKKQTTGVIRHVVFRKVWLTGPSEGPVGSIVFNGLDGSTAIDDVTFDNVRRNGAKVTAKSKGIITNGKVGKISFH
ncbi:MAG TPA: glycosyl hydrolase family 28 protein [Phycisphaerae bacterium]|nr:glycosyl hydrolase family 28 protein [Phycisphaerae bacterium]